MARRSDRTADLPELASTRDVAALLGVDKMTLKRWRDSGVFAVQPRVTSAGPVWTVADVERFREERGILPPDQRPGSRHARAAAPAV